MEDKNSKLIRQAGAPVPDNQNVQSAGPGEPMLMQNFLFLEKIANFDREVIPERRMYAKGSGAFGTFTFTHDIAQYSKAKVFNEVGKKTEMVTPFSIVLEESGTADIERDIRGFAMKYYTEEGIWNLAKTYQFHPFDLTKIWSKKDYPLIPVGEFELNRNPENYFQDAEQAAFSPTNIVPEIGFSPDKMPRGRLFSYGDAQPYRPGVNHYQIPVNKPTCFYHAFHRDGAMRADGNYGGAKHCEPNSSGEWQEQPESKEPPLALDGTAYAHNFRDDDADCFTQPGDLFRIIRADGKEDLLFKNTSAQAGGTDKFIQVRHFRNCFRADPEYGEGVTKALRLTMDEVNNFDMKPNDKWVPDLPMDRFSEKEICSRYNLTAANQYLLKFIRIHKED